MREFTRQIIVCTHCGAKISTGFGFSSKKDRDPKNDIHAIWSEPPGITASCPLCQNPVDTTSAYPVLANFPPFCRAKGVLRWVHAKVGNEPRFI